MSTLPAAPLQQEDQSEQQQVQPMPISIDPIADNKAMQTVVQNLAKYVIGLDKWARRQEVMDARRQRFYWRNDQYIYWKSDAVGFIPATAGAVTTVDIEGEMPRYTDVYNIYTPYGESLITPDRKSTRLNSSHLGI